MCKALFSAADHNRLLPSSKNPHFQNEAKCKPFLRKWVLFARECVWALNLVLIQRPGGTRKWPIGLQSTIIHFARETGPMLCQIAQWACFGTLTPLSLTGALDPIGLSPLVPLWSLHNIVFFMAATLHLDEISKSPENSAQQIFVDNCRIAQKTGAKLFPQNNPITQFNTKVTRYHVQPQNGRHRHKEIC